MKKKLSVLLVLVLAVAISAYSVGGTYAKYTSTIDVAGTATVAKWAIAMKQGETTLTNNSSFDLIATRKDTLDGNDEANVAASRIAPGTYGSFGLTVDGTGTEVDFTYTVSFTVTGKPANLKFYSDAAMNTEIVPNETTGVYSMMSDTIANTAESKISTGTVYWKWVYETTDGDGADTANGIAGGESGTAMVVNATVTATQVD